MKEKNDTSYVPVLVLIGGFIILLISVILCSAL